MIKERKHYQSNLESVIAERAETIGLCREFGDFAEFVGYLHIVSDDGTKELYEVTLRNDAGQIANVITKSENVVKQIDEIVAALGNTPRNQWLMGFRERKTKTGNNYIEVTLTTRTGAAPVEAQTTEEQ